MEITDLDLSELMELYRRSKSMLGRKMYYLQQMNAQIRHQAVSGEEFFKLLKQRKDLRAECGQLQGNHEIILSALQEKTNVSWKSTPQTRKFGTPVLSQPLAMIEVAREQPAVDPTKGVATIDCII